MITLAPIAHDSRILRQIDALSRDYEVDVIHPDLVANPPWTDLKERWASTSSFETFARFIAKSSFGKLVAGLWLLSRAFKLFYWSPRFAPFWLLRSIRKSDWADYGLVVANDLESLPLAIRVSRGSPVVADLHEFGPGEEKVDTLKKRLMSRLKVWIIENYLPKCRHVTVVNESVARLYSSEFGIQASVVANVPSFVELVPSPVDAGRIHLVHHGGYRPDRGIEEMITALASVDSRFVLNLVLADAPGDKLRELAESVGVEGDRLIFHNFQEPTKLVEFLNQFDVELILTRPDSPNNFATLPNKFFEAIQARLGVVSGPSPEIVKIVDRELIGSIARDFSAQSLQEVLYPLSAEEITKWKVRSNELARIYCWENVCPDYLQFGALQ